MSLHMMGKESNNYFTPITNLNQVAPNIQRRTIHVNSTTNDAGATEKTINHDPQDHPVYGFKSGLIKVIGNMVYRNKMHQDLVSKLYMYIFRIKYKFPKRKMYNFSSINMYLV